MEEELQADTVATISQDGAEQSVASSGRNCWRCCDTQDAAVAVLDMRPFLLTKSNPIHEVIDPIQSNPIYKCLVLNRARKLTILIVIFNLDKTGMAKSW